MHGLIAGHCHDLAFGRTTTNISILGMHVVKSGVKDRSFGNLVARKLSKEGPIQYLVADILWKMILDNNASSAGWSVEGRILRALSERNGG